MLRGKLAEFMASDIARHARAGVKPTSQPRVSRTRKHRHKTDMGYICMSVVFFGQRRFGEENADAPNAQANRDKIRPLYTRVHIHLNGCHATHKHSSIRALCVSCGKLLYGHFTRFANAER